MLPRSTVAASPSSCGSANASDLAPGVSGVPGVSAVSPGAAGVLDGVVGLVSGSAGSGGRVGRAGIGVDAVGSATGGVGLKTMLSSWVWFCIVVELFDQSVPASADITLVTLRACLAESIFRMGGLGVRGGRKKGVENR